MAPAHPEDSLDERGPLLPPPLEEEEIRLLRLLVYPAPEHECPCECAKQGRAGARLAHLMAEWAGNKATSAQVVAPTPSEFEAFSRECDGDRHPTRPWLSCFDHTPVGRHQFFKAAEQVGFTRAAEMSLADELPEPPVGLWVVDSASVQEVIDLLTTLKRAGHVEHEGNFIDGIARVTEKGRHALDANLQGPPAIQPNQPTPPAESRVAPVPELDVDEDGRFLLGGERLVYGERQIALRLWSPGQETPGRALVEWIRGGQRPGWVKAKTVSYLRQALGEQAIQGRGAGARLVLRLRLSRRLTAKLARRR